MQSTRVRCASLLLVVIAGGLLVPPKAASAQADRLRWTTSRFKGSPEVPPPYVVEPVFERLTFDRPGALAQAPGSNRLFVAELGGEVVSFPADGRADKVDAAIDLAAIRRPFSSLYGMAFHPKFAENRYLYLCYVFGDGLKDGTKVARFTVGRDDPPKIDPASETPILDWLGGGHNGGCLQFGKDGYLYISTGDGAGPTPPDTLGTGQDLRDLLSSILRIDVDHAENGRNYRIPPDNPFRDAPPARPEIWAYGFRNPWRMSIDPPTGDLWVGDVGWELWEMIDKVKRGGNYGWSVVEGPQSVHPDGRRGPTPILPPTTYHPHSEAASITGGYVYRGSRLKELSELYIYGDYQSGTVWGLRTDGDKVVSRSVLAETGLRLGSFGVDAENELYLIEVERTNRIYRLKAAPQVAASAAFPRTLGESGLFASTREHRPAPGVVPYRINAPQWADGTIAERWMGLPGDGRVQIVAPQGGGRQNGEAPTLKAPEGTVLARTVSVELKAGDPASRRRIETQVLHLQDGSWRPYAYLWNDDQTDATLAPPAGLSKTYKVQDARAPGGSRELNYRIAARSECVLCHNPWVEAKTTVFGRQSASPLAFNEPQLAVGDDRHDQLDDFDAAGLLERVERTVGRRLTDPYDARAPLDARARSYLQVNCAHCHQFNAGGAATILLSANLPLDQMKAVDAVPTQGTFGIDDARIVAPGAPERSVLYYRVAKSGAGRMPRLGSHRVDPEGAGLLAEWIAGLPSPKGSGKSSRPAEADKIVASVAIDRANACARLISTSRGALWLVQAHDRGEIDASLPTLAANLAKTNSGVEVADLFERFLPDSERVARLGASWDPSVVLSLQGDPSRGRALFFGGSTTSCKNCHRIGSEGTSVVGPDLEGVGSKYGKPEILAQIREPSREIAVEYLTHVVATKDGRVVSGRLVENKGSQITLIDARGKTTAIRSTDVDERSTQAISLMPEGLLNEMTAGQAADLLAFLAGLKSPPTK